MSGSKPKTNKITPPMLKEIIRFDDSAFLEEEDKQQYHLLIGQLPWAILLRIFNIGVATLVHLVVQYIALP
jgi:hypothetical protein